MTNVIYMYISNEKTNGLYKYKTKNIVRLFFFFPLYQEMSMSNWLKSICLKSWSFMGGSSSLEKRLRSRIKGGSNRMSPIKSIDRQKGETTPRTPIPPCIHNRLVYTCTYLMLFVLNLSKTVHVTKHVFFGFIAKC